MSQFEHMHLQQLAIGIAICVSETQLLENNADCYIRVFDCKVRI